MTHKTILAVVIPCFKVKKHILNVLRAIGPEVSLIYVVDDLCPEHTGDYVKEHCDDPRVKIITHEKNKGVGGAVISGYRQALQDQATIIIKIDGDGQMNPAFINRFVHPITQGIADYTKGNRFFAIENLNAMPKIRLFGNSILSLVNKISSGYWNIMDPTNGYTAIHEKVLRYLPLEKIEGRYFFESDMLFRLNTIRAVVYDIPLQASYADEESNLNIKETALSFPKKYLARFFKRIFYNYFLRDFNAGSIELFFGSIIFSWGLIYGAAKWFSASLSKLPAPTGTIVLSALLILVGFQLLLSSLKYDIDNIPKICLHTLLA